MESRPVWSELLVLEREFQLIGYNWPYRSSNLHLHNKFVFFKSFFYLCGNNLVDSSLVSFAGFLFP
jgi:hypothetical protein